MHMLRDCNEQNLEKYASINWRASLVPAAAVIPAPIAYIKIVAVKAFVVKVSHFDLARHRFRVSTKVEVQCGSSTLYYFE
jgi:hypothetical protein